MQREDRPVVLLPVADAALGPGPVQAAALDLGRHLPAERLAVGRARHHRPHQLPRPAALRLRAGASAGRAAAAARPAAARPRRLDLRGQPRRLHRVEELRRRLRLRVGGVRRRGEGLAAGDLDLVPGGVRTPPAGVPAPAPGTGRRRPSPWPPGPAAPARPTAAPPGTRPRRRRGPRPTPGRSAR